jgi:hypothetical protein
VLRATAAVPGALALAGCTVSTNDGVSISFGEPGTATEREPPARTDSPPTTDPATPTDTPTATETRTDTPTATETPYPTPSFDEDCLSFDPETVEITETDGGDYLVVNSESRMLLFEEFEHARAARDVITGYGFSRHCFVGRPSPPMTYWTVDGAPAAVSDASPVDTEDCVRLDPAAIAIEENGSGGYRIVSDQSILLDFDELANATRARDVIQHYGFTRHCFVGRPDPPFEYWLAGD